LEGRTIGYSMKILVTGGTGVIGAAAIPELLRAGHSVRLLSRHAEEDTPSFPQGVEPFPADINNPRQLAGAAVGCDAVLHIAGIVEERLPEITFHGANVAGTEHLLDAAAQAGFPTFIFLSSLGADRGESAYHGSKRQAEERVRAYAGPWVILRSGNVYGPGDETISMLLKMVRTLPAVPMVGDGDQPFQPLWFADLGRAIAQTVENRSLAGQTLELAGPDVTTTDDILTRLEQITDRSPMRLAVPVWLTEVGVQAAEALGSFGQRLLERARLAMPINSSKLSMLLEENVICDSSRNALPTRFKLEPTPLQRGLEMLADMLPEQTPGDGVGAIHWARYFADIKDSPLSPEALLNRVCARINEVMPLEFAAEPGVPECAEEGSTLTAAIPGRGHIQVRVEERDATSVTFATLEGHPLAGLVRLETERAPAGLRFAVNVVAQPANVLDWIAMRTIGGTMQSSNWREVVRRVVQLSEGSSLAGVQKESGTLDDKEAGAVHAWAQRLVQRQQRKQKETGVDHARLATACAP
jgi:NADH dehydrogenase